MSFDLIEQQELEALKATQAARREEAERKAKEAERAAQAAAKAQLEFTAPEAARLVSAAINAGDTANVAFTSVGGRKQRATVGADSQRLSDEESAAFRDDMGGMEALEALATAAETAYTEVVRQRLGFRAGTKAAIACASFHNMHLGLKSLTGTKPVTVGAARSFESIRKAAKKRK